MAEQPASPPHQLPIPSTPLAGRERDLAAVRALLQRSAVRLVTLAGLGEMGKTRLAIAVAATILDDFRDGVCVVNLAPLRDPALVA